VGFLLPGLALLYYFKTSDSVHSFIGIIFGPLLVILAIAALLKRESSWFDFQNKEALVQYRPLSKGKYPGTKVDLKEAYALQILEEVVYTRRSGPGNSSGPGKKGTYMLAGDQQKYLSYELNLILKDRSRINIVDHGDLNDIRESAQKLADRLHIEVWDGTWS
jgi:hypothetical protein